MMKGSKMKIDLKLLIQQLEKIRDIRGIIYESYGRIDMAAKRLRPNEDQYVPGNHTFENTDIIIDCNNELFECLKYFPYVEDMEFIIKILKDMDSKNEAHK